MRDFSCMEIDVTLSRFSMTSASAYDAECYECLFVAG